jgi:hypothetical protein
MFPDAAPTKLLAYADDLLVFLSKPTEWHKLMNSLKVYNSASNAKVDLLKQKFSGRQSTPRMDILLETITLPMT